MSDSHRYSEADRAAIYRVMKERRDMRHFRPDAIPSDAMQRLLEAAHDAPSVGYMQPWRFIRITDAGLRADLAMLVEKERQRTALALGERSGEFLRLKVEGIRECSELWVVALTDDRQQYVFGRRTMPRMDLASASCAIQNLWLAARAEGIGMGWVSLFDPDALAERLAMPATAEPIAILCMGYVNAFYEKPMLEQSGWDQRRNLATLIGVNEWPEISE
ncbi:5,6-dimethylbenzimidazole synthase [Kushneria phosphatilytica]|uniref:5,6-dimethylbenzimidazole synthase n=1 Tax=Kushneria phosphatilytica TaxID=657387 RepID=A0A1S1NWE2_9GAMM|nr:5,6-dimethylbenzimidazole synthase [Kushneria phosphatilytica]OHV11882.1 5,6-dimethylbenzimidazole synthase [Kushneria phosphatilytica]QEL11055.1 5,6-dimethylbenzimidazole synthase [Kushneria phosphatilytica]